MSAAPVRREALGILVAVAEGGSLDVELEAGRTRVAPESQALLTELVRGALQWQARYDHIIGRFAWRRRPRDPRLLAILRLTLHQLLALDGVPAYAAIHQAGELCRETLGARQVGFVNGLLRAVRRQLLPSGETPDTRDVREERLQPLFADLEPGSAAWLAAWHSHPGWLVERWMRTFGDEATTAICAWNNQRPPVVFHVSAPADVTQTASDLAAMGLPVQPGPGPRALTASGAPARGSLVRALASLPSLIVQDGAVQAATAWLATTPAPCGPLVDLCAAPGGKTAHLAGVWPADERIVALDRHPARVQLLADTVKRIEARRVDVLLADGARPPLAPGSCAAVVLDGPCSGTGVLRHHPDGRWRLRRNCRRGEVNSCCSWRRPRWTCWFRVAYCCTRPVRWSPRKTLTCSHSCESYARTSNRHRTS